MNKTTSALAILMCSVAAVGCDDPSKGKSKATAGDAVTVTSQQTTPAAAGTTKYSFNQDGSKVAWTGSKVTGKHDGGFGVFTGTVDVQDGAPEKSRVTVDIDTASLTSDSAKLTRHLASADFFDVAQYPKATFISTTIKAGGDKGATHTVTGNLTIKGVTKSVTFPATITVGGGTANVNAEFAINRRDFQLNYAGMPNDLIRDDVVIALTIKGKQAS